MKKIVNNNTTLSLEGVKVKTLGQIAAYSPYEEMRHRAYDDLITIGKMLETIKRLTNENRELRKNTPPIITKDFKL
jgi:hypothetical protein